jgi:uncharacterized membrane protein
MKFIRTRTHGILDYTWATLLIISPWLFNFANGGAAQNIAIIIGVIVLLMSLVTNYELGVIKRIPMPTHLAMDIIIGAFLAISPWLFGFNEVVFVPHLIFGIFSIGSGMFTKRTPSASHVLIHGRG